MSSRDRRGERAALYAGGALYAGIGAGPGTAAGAAFISSLEGVVAVFAVAGAVAGLVFGFIYR